MKGKTAALLASLLAAALHAPTASAQTAAERAASAQVLFDDATKLVAAGRFAEACPKFKSAQDLDPGMATQFRLAECYEKLGKLASAWALYVEVADAAKGEKSVKREALARKRAAAVEPRLSRLTITVPPAVASLEGLTIKRDGIVIDKPLWGMAVPVDPGEHAIAAAAPGKKGWEGVGAAVPEGKTGEVVIPPLEDAPLAVTTSSQIVSADAGLPATERRSVVPGVVLGAGALVAAGVGVGMYFLANAQKNTLIEDGKLYPQGSCLVPTPPAYCNDLKNRAYQVDTTRTISVGAFVGAGVLAIGAVTYLLWPNPRPKAPTHGSLQVSPLLGAGTNGMVVSGSF